MQTFDFDKIRKEYEAEIKDAKDVEVPMEQVIHYACISIRWNDTLIGICKGLQKQITELEEAMQKMKTNRTDRSLKWKRQFD